MNAGRRAELIFYGGKDTERWRETEREGAVVFSNKDNIYAFHSRCQLKEAQTWKSIMERFLKVWPMLVQSISLENENMMFVCLAPRHIQISLDLMMETEIFFFLRVREEEKIKMKTEGWRGSVSKLCLSLFFSAFLPFFLFPSHIQKP